MSIFLDDSLEEESRLAEKPKEAVVKPTLKSVSSRPHTSSSSSHRSTASRRVRTICMDNKKITLLNCPILFIDRNKFKTKWLLMAL